VKAAGAAVLVFLLAAASPAPLPTALRFEDGTAASGVSFTHVPTRTARKLMPEVLGSGVVIADFNRDGAPDLLLVNAGALGQARPPAARNRLYLNDGKGHFTDRTEAWALPSSGYGMGAAAGDYDGDGWTDVFLTTFEGADVLLRNEGGARFVDVTARAGLRADGRWSTSAGFFDLEGDGDLDLWVTRYVAYDPARAVDCYYAKVQVYCTPVLYDPLPDRLLRNNGDGTFTDVSGPSGVGARPGKGLALLLADVEPDGDTDVYVANDTTPNHLWINDGRGRLREQALLSGVALSEMGTEMAGMGADLSDLDGDGRPDLAVANFQDETTSVYLQERPLVFREASDALGVGRTARARLKFGLDFFDADNDGDEDLLVANGHIADNVALYRPSVRFEQPDSLYENVGRGRFRDVSEQAGPALQDRQVGRGLATGDLDGDGRLDYVITHNGGTAQVGHNATGGAGHFVSLWLEGVRANRSAIGARVVARAGGLTLSRQIVGSSSYLSMSDPRVHLGLGAATRIDELTIHWPGSRPQVVTALAADAFYRVVEGKPPERYVPGQAVLKP
jgi:enediyne biosynthesis protein E4